VYVQVRPASHVPLLPDPGAPLLGPQHGSPLPPQARQVYVPPDWTQEVAAAEQ
jgi:hypothetical protein